MVIISMIRVATGSTVAKKFLGKPNLTRLLFFLSALLAATLFTLTVYAADTPSGWGTVKGQVDMGWRHGSGADSRGHG